MRHYPNHPRYYYKTACMYALQNKVEDSIYWLRKAIKKGYDNWILIKSDKQLKNIRSSPGYRALLNGH